jgi:hypothetical protein
VPSRIRAPSFAVGRTLNPFGFGRMHHAGMIASHFNPISADAQPHRQPSNHAHKSL